MEKIPQEELSSISLEKPLSSISKSCASKARDHDGVITDLEPDILECEVKWALESITMNKASWRGWNSS